MRKTGWITLGGIVGAILIAWIVAMFVIGGGIRQGLEQSLADMKAASSGVAQTFEITEYKKGVASSTAKSKVLLPEISDGSQPVFTLDHKISHGPLVFTSAGPRFAASHVVTTVDLDGLSPDIKESFERGFSTKTPLEIEATSGFGGATDFVIELAYFNDRIKSADGSSSRVEIGGIEGEVNGVGGDETEGELKIGNIRVKGDDGVEINLEEGKWRIEGEEMDGEMMLKGMSAAEFPRLTVKVGDDTFIANDLVFSQQASHEAGKVTTLQLLKTGGLRIPGGEQYDLLRNLVGKGVEWGFKMGNMDVELAKKISAEFSEVRAKEAAGASEEERMDEETMQRVIMLVLEIIQPGTSLGIGLEAEGDAGKSTVNLDLQWVAKEPLLKTKVAKQAIAGLKIDVKTELPVAVMDDPMAAGFLQAGVQQGMLVVGEDKITGSAALVHSSATLNGKSFPLDQMLGPFLEMPLDWEKMFSGEMMPGGAMPGGPGAMPGGPGAMPGGPVPDELMPDDDAAPVPDENPATPDPAKGEGGDE